jgi:pimeloyl-ACP methyl ester carboxylesterase
MNRSSNNPWQWARRAMIVAGLAIGAVGGVTVQAGLPPAVAASCSTASTPSSVRPMAGSRPVIFVHGWTSNSEALRNTGAKLTAQTGNRIATYYFDYAPNATTWAAADVIAGCLASYITDVSRTYQSAGGDGKVLVVAHSMGGLATLYASVKSDAGKLLGGVVTFDTPYLGSPFGDTSIAGFLQGLKQHGGVNVPPGGSDAQVCLAEHQLGADLPSGCHAQLPPYLPVEVPVTEIAGRITVKRMLGPFHLYDLSLDSDGIVATPSSHGYLSIRRSAQWPRGERLTLATDACTITSDTIQLAVRSARWTKSLLAALASGTGQIYADNNALDGLLSGSMTPGLAAYLGAATLAAPCSHVHVYNDQSGLNQATEALKSYLNALTPPCVTAAELVAALPSDRQALLPPGDPSAAVNPVVCSGTWAAAGVTLLFPGATYPDGSPVGNTVTVIAHYIADHWHIVDRQGPCDAGQIPADIYILACRSN